MAQRVKVRFRRAGKTYELDSGGLALMPGDRVIVDTASGVEIGRVIATSHHWAAAAAAGDAGGNGLEKILRKATQADLEREVQDGEKARHALRICREKVAKYNLNMDPIEAEYALDDSKVTIYFLAEGRVDFRELVRDLAGTLRTRVELRQVGVRDEARMVGGLGPCGRTLCCATFLTEFKPVSIKMAKEQNLPLNPGKISGVCGRLMCCLRYESQLGREAEGDQDALAAVRDGAAAGCCGSTCGGCGQSQGQGQDRGRREKQASKGKR